MHTTGRRTNFLSRVGAVAMVLALAVGSTAQEMMPVDDGAVAPDAGSWAPAPAPTVAEAPSPALAPSGDAVEEVTIVDIAVGDARFATLVTALTAVPDLLDALETPGPWTVFAPTNDAVASFLTENGLSAEQLLMSPGLGDVLRKHVVAGKLTSEDVVAAVAMGPISLTTLGGVQIDCRLVDGTLYVGGAAVIQFDIMADNGVVHVLDRVIQ